MNIGMQYFFVLVFLLFGSMSRSRITRSYGRSGAFPDGSAYNVGDLENAVCISRFGRSPGGGNGNPLQYSYLKNPMERGTFASKGSQRVWT